MGKYTIPAIALFLIFLVIAAGCINTPSSSASNQNQKSTVKPTVKTTTPVTTETTIAPLFKVGDIAQTSSNARTGLAIVNYNTATQEYGTVPIVHDSKGDGWHTDGFQMTTWKKFSTMHKEYKFIYSTTVSILQIPDYDSTLQKPNVFSSAACDLVGDYSANKGNTTYMFRMDRVVVNQTGNQTYIGTWSEVRSIDKRRFFIQWNYTLTPNSSNYAQMITLSSDYSKFTGKDNYGNNIDATWIGLVPSWKAELDKAKLEEIPEVASNADCYRWLGGNEW